VPLGAPTSTPFSKLSVSSSPNNNMQALTATASTSSATQPSSVLSFHVDREFSDDERERDVMGDYMLDRLHRVAKLVEENNPSFTDLDLFAENIGPAGLQIIADALEKNNTITILFLGLNNLGDPGALVIARLMQTHPTLSSVFLRDNDIGPVGVQAVGKALLAPKCRITEIFLGFNRFVLPDVELIAHVLRVNNTLSLLDLDGNALGDEGAQLIASALSENTGLVELHFANNNVSDVGGSALASMLTKNKTLLRLNLDGHGHNSNHISSGILDFIRVRLCRNASRPARFALLQGSVSGTESAIFRSFVQNPLFDPRVLSLVFQFNDAITMSRNKYDASDSCDEEDDSDQQRTKRCKLG